jgi:hypothetical protein
LQSALLPKGEECRQKGGYGRTEAENYTERLPRSAVTK